MLLAENYRPVAQPLELYQVQINCSWSYDRKHVIIYLSQWQNNLTQDTPQPPPHKQLLRCHCNIDTKHNQGFLLLKTKNTKKNVPMGIRFSAYTSAFLPNTLPAHPVYVKLLYCYICTRHLRRNFSDCCVSCVATTLPEVNKLVWF